MNLFSMTQSNSALTQMAIEQDFLTYLLLAEEGNIWELSGNEPALATQDSGLLAWDDSLGEQVDPFLEEGYQAFCTTLDQVWQTQSMAVPVPALAAVTYQDLWTKFGVNVPEETLRAIVRQAQVALKQSQAGVDAAIMCVQALLPQWSIEDLQVFNRPLVYAMRSSQDRGNMLLSALQNQDWDHISDFDKARLYLAIAQYVINAETPPNL